VKNPRKRRKTKLRVSEGRCSTGFDIGKKWRFNPTQSILHATWKKLYWFHSNILDLSRVRRAAVKGYTEKKQLWLTGLEQLRASLFAFMSHAENCSSKGQQ